RPGEHVAPDLHHRALHAAQQARLVGVLVVAGERAHAGVAAGMAAGAAARAARTALPTTRMSGAAPSPVAPETACSTTPPAARARGGDGAHEGRVADVGEAEQPRVGEHAQLEAERALLARRPRLGAARGPVGRGGEVHVAAPAAAAARDDGAFARGAEIGEQL